MMWASLLLAGILSGWWGALALAAAPPANRNSLEETSTRTTSVHPPSMSIAAEKPFDYPLSAWNFVTRTIDRHQDLAPRTSESPDDVPPSKPNDQERSEDEFGTSFWSPVQGPENGNLQSSMLDAPDDQRTSRPQDPAPENSQTSEEQDDSIRDVFVSSSKQPNRRLEVHPKAEESSLMRLPRHSSTPFSYSWSESSMERPRVVRSAKQRPKNRTKADSAREQRRRCRNKGCRGQNWCPDVDVGNRAFLAPTVFEGKARSMSSARKPGSNYAVTFEVKQVYKSQPGFQPLQKNDSVRLHFRDKSAPGKSTVCGYDTDGKQQQQRDNQSGVVRANIKRGKVYLVFVNRVGPRNFTILGEPVIRSKKNEQAVQAVVRPDYVREVTLSELRDSIARLRERVKLVCRTRGSPPPRVHWLKDGIPLQPRRGLRIQHKRRRSKVVISSAKPEDSGRYECVAESTSGHRASLAAQLLVAHDTRIPETTTAAWPRQEQPCPIAGDFCMNGGTCLFFETVGEPACRCAEGFTGLRCETKDVISTGNMDKFSSFAEDVTLARF
ncbi:membrane-bound neuregulin protein vein isoform X2 [Calliopsis andreniformis]|uniref:membrane-bound neuregulin protein vein isoform X2 n=1 Tax=Calliopsis andreniformis TaxID=337506 RepID=UPI003FCDBBCC